MACFVGFAILVYYCEILLSWNLVEGAPAPYEYITAIRNRNIRSSSTIKAMNIDGNRQYIIGSERVSEDEIDGTFDLSSSSNQNHLRFERSILDPERFRAKDKQYDMGPKQMKDGSEYFK